MFIFSFEKQSRVFSLQQRSSVVQNWNDISNRKQNKQKQCDAFREQNIDRDKWPFRRSGYCFFPFLCSCYIQAAKICSLSMGLLNAAWKKSFLQASKRLNLPRMYREKCRDQNTRYQSRGVHGTAAHVWRGKVLQVL